MTEMANSFRKIPWRRLCFRKQCPSRFYLPNSYFWLLILIIFPKVSDALVYTRASSVTIGPQVEEFAQAVRARDGGCVVSKARNYEVNLELGLASSHQQTRYKELRNHGRWITIDPPQGDKPNCYSTIL